MIDHMGMHVRDVARSTEFYLKALAPLGYGIVMQVSMVHRDSRPNITPIITGRSSSIPTAQCRGRLPPTGMTREAQCAAQFGSEKVHDFGCGAGFFSWVLGSVTSA